MSKKDEVQVYIDDRPYGKMTFSRWNAPEKAMRAAIIQFSPFFEEEEGIIGVECNEENKTVKFVTETEDDH